VSETGRGPLVSRLFATITTSRGAPSRGHGSSPPGSFPSTFANMRVGAGCHDNTVEPFAYPALLIACYHHQGT
jgi:hypothetical protein